jgi:hypothetical protein
MVSVVWRVEEGSKHKQPPAFPPPLAHDIYSADTAMRYDTLFFVARCRARPQCRSKTALARVGRRRYSMASRASGKGQCAELCGQLYGWRGAFLQHPRHPPSERSHATIHPCTRVVCRSSSGSANLEAAHDNFTATAVASSGQTQMSKATFLLARSAVPSPVNRVDNGHVDPSLLSSGLGTSSMHHQHTVAAGFGAPSADP